MATHTPSTGLYRIPRRDDGKIVAGVCTGLGAFAGIDPNLLRVGFAVCSLAGGLGILGYAGAWVLMAPPASPEPEPRRAPDPIQAAALGVVVLGLLLFARAFGLWPGDAIVWPLAAAGLGVALLWMRPIRTEDSGEPLTLAGAGSRTAGGCPGDRGARRDAARRVRARSRAARC